MTAILIPILIQIESGGWDGAIGDQNKKHKAYGPLQIRQPVCDDYNLMHGTKIRARDCLDNWRLSKKICRWYLGHYATEKRLGRRPTFEDLARVWNGGPDGWKRETTKPYWAKVAKELKKKKGK